MIATARDLRARLADRLAAVPAPLRALIEEPLHDVLIYLAALEARVEAIEHLDIIPLRTRVARIETERKADG